MYHTEIDGSHHELGTSGFLYRSSKLMYDQKTKSMWSTLQGRPVVGTLLGQGLQLTTGTVVTTNWGKWRELHPSTRVVSLDGVKKLYQRDYSEGAAYRKYFASNRLMFPVPNQDARLKNKTPVFVLRIDNDSSESELELKPIAFESKFLIDHPVYHHSYGNLNVVILTDESGAHRAYDAGETKFETLSNNATVMDSEKNSWQITTDELILEKAKRKRLSSHNAYWFGWFSQFPNTELIQLNGASAE